MSSNFSGISTGCRVERLERMSEKRFAKLAMAAKRAQ